MNVRVPLVDRMAKHTAARPNGCQEWTGSHDRKGYGRIKANGKNQAAHRVAWELAFGAIPDGLFVLHRCDNPPCVKPAHLFLGTNAVNMADCVAKGRTYRRHLDECHQGHVFDEANTYRPPGSVRPQRRCRACAREYGRRYFQRKNAETERSA